MRDSVEVFRSSNSIGDRAYPLAVVSAVLVGRKQLPSCLGLLLKCQTPSKRRTDERTDVENRIWCILALKCDIWCQ